MKKVCSCILVAVMCLSLCACGKSSEKLAPTEEVSVEINTTPQADSDIAPSEDATIPSESADTKKADCWQVDYLVDDFGDSTDKACLKSVVAGEFSNTATMGDDLAVVIFMCPSCSNDENTSSFAFRLIEYNDHPATYLSSDEIIMKVKIGEEIIEETLFGAAPNGDLLLMNGLVAGQFVKSDLFAAIYNALVLGQESVRCIVEIGSSKYSFTIDGKGFADAANEMMSIYGYTSYDVRKYLIDR